MVRIKLDIYTYMDILYNMAVCRASHQVYEDIQHCTGVDLSEDMLSIAERLQGKYAGIVWGRRM